ncbi:hypothetical protein OZ830_004385 [Yersinia enterocolitica]|uniref:hypothetical protein n=1 Tax=Yersinia enterocolitica TaxID=630 RepID=UPI00313C70C7|nr:hypothetical protein [Yersinia enterocolitica]
MLIGFVLLIASCFNDSCNALPVTEDTYPTQSECQQISTLIKERRPDVVLVCGEVYRSFD